MKEDTIAENLRRIRAEQGASLSRTADLTGVSKAMLGQIERRESSPTVATLWKIAQGMRVSLSSLLQEPTCPDGAATVRFPGSIAVRIVFPFDAAVGAETFEITLKPGQTHCSDAHESGLIEDVFVLSGGLDVKVAEERRELAQGQAFRFAADQPHEYCAGDQGAVFLNIHFYNRSVF